VKLFMKFQAEIRRKIRRLFYRMPTFLRMEVYCGKHLSKVPNRSIIFFPCRDNIFGCGLAGIVSYKNKTIRDDHIDMGSLNEMLKEIKLHQFNTCQKNNLNLDSFYLGGKAHIESLMQSVRSLKREDHFYNVFVSKKNQDQLTQYAGVSTDIINTEASLLSNRMGHLETDVADTLSRRLDDLRDICWCLTTEIAENIKKINDLLRTNDLPDPACIKIFKQLNAVLNSIDRLEVRGRDSAGISLMFVLDAAEYEKFKETIIAKNLFEQFKDRAAKDVMVNRNISMHAATDPGGGDFVTLALTYKIAAEIGSLGDNVNFLRTQIKLDEIMQTLVTFSHRYHTVSAHTRWASIGAITEPNCHPVDNQTAKGIAEKVSIIHVCLNGDIDNYLELKKEFERQGVHIHEDITTDTKIIPLQIDKYVQRGHDVGEAFRLAVNDFKGSHAISMHTDLAPGKFFLAQKGSGQGIFVGIGDDHYMPTSEVYGLVEETPYFIKMDGEKEVQGQSGKTRGQIFILDQESAGGIDGIKAMFYDRTPVELGETDIKHTEITSRDIDRQDFPHYFLKEISESPLSVDKTLENRWKIREDGQYIITLDEKTFPEALQNALMNREIRRLYFIGQGTAGVAALACADIFNHYLHDSSFFINALKASELSGFKLDEQDDATSMADALVIAISQSGTTTDTNRTVEMVRERGAYTMAIVNRRDSDITFKVDGVMYTSSGRDIEMSVASTKAFYSQIVAGAVVGLKITEALGLRNDDFITAEIKQLLELPMHMEKVLAMRAKIQDSAQRLASTKTYWAAVGSGPNKASADEIRIKLSELCYKTISSDYVEDKKHIDLSSEPLLIICAAGTRRNVIGDIIKDTAIFQAHKATPIVITDEGEHRFDTYATDVFHVPVVSEHLAPVLNTLVGHIWGYYAALAINAGSRFLYGFRENVQNTIDDYAAKGLDVYELILDKSFREKIAIFYKEFRSKKAQNNFPTAMGIEAASDLTLLLKYLSGRLPVSDFEIDFGKKGTALNMLDTLLECLGESINCLSRPVDAIRHQAKTVTVGTSRISEKVEGILFDALADYNISISQLINRNILVLKNLQEIVHQINGAIFYKIDGLNLLGELTEETTIEIIKKAGVLEPISSRVETDPVLKGTKRIIVREGNIYIGIGRKDDRSIVVIPTISASPEKPNMIEYILLLTISFKENVPLPVKIKALGGKYERIKNIVQENSIVWDDQHIERVAIRDLFGISAEKIGEYIASEINGPAQASV